MSYYEYVRYLYTVCLPLSGGDGVVTACQVHRESELLQFWNGTLRAICAVSLHSNALEMGIVYKRFQKATCNWLCSSVRKHYCCFTEAISFR